MGHGPNRKRCSGGWAVLGWFACARPGSGPVSLCTVDSTFFFPEAVFFIYIYVNEHLNSNLNAISLLILIKQRNKSTVLLLEN
jgi:hypothetical protein